MWNMNFGVTQEKTTIDFGNVGLDLVELAKNGRSLWRRFSRRLLSL